MSVFQAEKQMEEFISSSQPGVLLIRGEWGTGKTFSWDRVVKRMDHQTRARFRSHVTVSLFGLSSIEDINREILTYKIPHDEGGNLTPLGNYIKNVAERKVSLLSRLSNSVSVSHVSSVGSVLNAVIPFLIKDQMICLDDFERKSDELGILEVLGYIDRLRTRYNCKVIVIANTNMLDEKERETFLRYFEKVVDENIAFEPNFEDMCAVVFPTHDASDPIIDGLRAVDCRNFRVAEKIRAMAAPLASHILHFDASARFTILRSFCLCCWVVLDKENAPTQEFINAGFDPKRLQDKSYDKIQMRWAEILKRSSFYNLDELDFAFLKTSEKGFVDIDSISDLLNAKNAEFIQLNGRSLFEAVWKPFYASMSGNPEQFTREMIEAIEKAAPFMSTVQLDQVLDVFRRADANLQSTKIIDLFMKIHSSSARIILQRRSHFGGRVKDEEFLQRLDQAVQLLPRTKLNIFDAAAAMARDEYDQRYISIIEEASEDQIYELFKERTGVELQALVDGFNNLMTLGLPEAEKQVPKVNSVFRRLIAEDELNAIRLRREMQPRDRVKKIEVAH